MLNKAFRGLFQIGTYNKVPTVCWLVTSRNYDVILMTLQVTTFGNLKLDALRQKDYQYWAIILQVRRADRGRWFRCCIFQWHEGITLLQGLLTTTKSGAAAAGGELVKLIRSQLYWHLRCAHRTINLSPIPLHPLCYAMLICLTHDTGRVTFPSMT